MEPIKIIPCLDMRDGRVVKGVHFTNIRDAGDPVEAARAYSAAGADEIAFLDILATVQRRATMLDLVKKIAAVIEVPLVVGGGIRSLEDIEDALRAGATSVSISSAAYRNPDLIPQAVARFGGERIIVAVDADASARMPSGRELFIDGGRTATGMDAVEFCVRMADTGVGRLLVTSKMADGTRQGYDLELTRAVADQSGLPVIASGGAGELEHFYQGVVAGHASALLAASVFHFGILTIPQVKQYLHERGIPVHLPSAIGGQTKS
ncbi:MAG: imidazole glycerol phosphate synthase subunit HisF [Chloroflexi bacterium]|nr:imidazole glycerol phosphate synthase subunit HisF [Chloroflexota bacterium]